MKSKKLVPNWRFPEFKNDEEWEEKTINDISNNITSGGTPSTSVEEYWNGNIRWMNSGELNLKQIYEVKGRITETGLKNSSTKIIPKECILIGLAGQGKTRGTVAINKIELCINQSIASIFPNKSIYNSDFLYHNLDYRYNELRELSTGGAGRGGLNLSIIKSLKIYLPSLLEQNKIADFLCSIENLINREVQKLVTLKEHKKALMQNLFPKGDETVPIWRFPEFSNDGEWEEKILDDVIDYENGKAHENDILEKGNYIVVNSKFISTEGQIIKYTNDAFCLASKNDILMVLSDIPNGRAIAKCYFVEDDNLYTVNQRICKLKAKNGINKFYFYSLNRNKYFLAFDDGVKQTNLRKDDVLNCPLLIPSNQDEQTKIADCMSSIDNIITMQTKKIEALNQHKKALMQNLFPSEEI